MNEITFNRIRKSLLMSWNVCPRQAWYAVRDPDYEQYNEFNLYDPTLLLGQVFHKEMDTFYSKVSVDEMIKKVNDKEKLQDYLFSLFSPTTHEKLLDYFNWYAEIETDRFIKLYEDNKTGIVQRFIPLYIEKYVEHKQPFYMFDLKGDVYRTGHFDRIDYIGDKSLRLVEYKTGESYDVTKSYKLVKLRLELYWYKEIIEKLEEFKDYTVDEWMLINPTTKTVFSCKFHVLTKRKLDDAFPKVVRDVNLPEPPARNVNFYCNRCKFKQECLINIDQNIFDII